MGYRLGVKSLKRLEGVNPLLVAVVKRAIEISAVDFGISEGVRTLDRQKQMVAEGKSKTLNSYHLRGDAVDVFAIDINGVVTWEMSFYEKINVAFQKAAEELGAKITWGGRWKSLKDGPHFQIEV